MKILMVIHMQKDFIDGTPDTPESHKNASDHCRK